MKTICLYGSLGQRFGRVHRYDVKTPAEAVRAMCATLDGFRVAIAQGAYRVLIGGKAALDESKLQWPTSDRETIRFIPVVSGAGKGLGQIIVGAALIYFSGGLAGAFGATGAAAGVAGAGAGAAGFLGVTAATFTNLGVSLLIGGVAQMLFAPKQAQTGKNERPENTPSYSFDGAVNTAAQGNPVPVLYGEVEIGSQVISAGLAAEQIPV